MAAQLAIQASSDFGSTTPITLVFRETTHDVFTVRIPTAQIVFHWRMVAYDTFQTDRLDARARARIRIR